MSERSSVHLAHHWLVGMRGGEAVLEQFSLLCPEAPIHTLVANPAKLSEALQRHRIETSFLQRLGGIRRYKEMLPLFPLAVGRMRVPKTATFVLSSDAAVIKGLRMPEGVPHVCYCHSPPRYLWDQQETYAKQTSGLGAFGRFVFRAVTPYVRRFDQNAARGVDHFIANSGFVAERIRRCYGREAAVIYPPVNVGAFEADRPRGDFYLIVSELAPYKRVDLAVEVFTRLGEPLVVIGDGPEMPRLRAMAGPTVNLMGRQPSAVLKEHYERCAAFLYPQVEDFGITAVEAQAAGAPVIALAAGGALESVLDDETGVFFPEQKVESLMRAIKHFEERRALLTPSNCRRNAERFRTERFRVEILGFLKLHYPSHFGFRE
jgi:glycosyltransferase involved in cell wall biosynthesis